MVHVRPGPGWGVLALGLRKGCWARKTPGEQPTLCGHLAIDPLGLPTPRTWVLSLKDAHHRSVCVDTTACKLAAGVRALWPPASRVSVSQLQKGDEAFLMICGQTGLET